MQYNIVMTSNMVRAVTAVDDLRHRSEAEEGMAVIFGRPGEGKSTTLAYLANKYRGIYTRASVAWTVTSMLQAIMKEMELEPAHRRAPMIDAAIDYLNADPRPLLIDEADYLLRQMDMMDAIRDIYDFTGVPVVLVLMESAPRKIRTAERLARFRRRITQWIEFDGLSYEDARLVATELSEVSIKDELVRRIFEQAKGNIGDLVIGLSRVEHTAKCNRLESIGLEQYGDRPLR